MCLQVLDGDHERGRLTEEQLVGGWGVLTGLGGATTASEAKAAYAQVKRGRR
jgi:hypothetical protein